jgi:hypothetical protein
MREGVMEVDGPLGDGSKVFPNIVNMEKGDE